MIYNCIKHTPVCRHTKVLFLFYRKIHSVMRLSRFCTDALQIQIFSFFERLEFFNVQWNVLAVFLLRCLVVSRLSCKGFVHKTSLQCNQTRAKMRNKHEREKLYHSLSFPSFGYVSDKQNWYAGAGCWQYHVIAPAQRWETFLKMQCHYKWSNWSKIIYSWWAKVELRNPQWQNLSRDRQNF